MILTRTTTPTEDTALTFLAADRSERLPVPMTAAEFLVTITDGAIADAVAEFITRQAGTREDKFSRATKEDQAAVDTILSKY